MPNGTKKVNKPKDDILVLALKLVILLVILLLPVSFMILDSSRFLLLYQVNSQNSSFSASQKDNNALGAEFNLQIPISSVNMGDQKAVSPAKIDSLFSNLKH